MKLTASPTGSITDKAFYILEAATVLVVTANKISAKIRRRSSTVALAKHEAKLVEKQLREAAIMIDNLLAIIEQREMVNLNLDDEARFRAPS
ncbi:hypothetical protein [Bradyrhizobium sp.]|uniref:hypothetical protein n=1 Tax=Bradyrhizobium sp. TaxID=376 RepID=UPI001EB18A90|nr:hypothetical protein [Bradyrhizobium sp.]MBV9979034.1 hypothetical protein [Bradyrhizobium sp.]